jgi:hypothetical protein
MNGRFVLLAAAVLLGVLRVHGTASAVRTVATQNVAATAPAKTDPALDGAQALIGRALFVRDFYGGGELAYDAAGKIAGQPHHVDWTLAGADIQRVARHDAAALELDGVRVAIRYNPDQHIFERHPQKDQKLKILLAVNPEARGLQGARATVFAVGIDPALQRSMPPYWRHYFTPALEWPNDDLSGAPIVPVNAAAGGGLEYPVLDKKIEPDFTMEARLDHVRGVVQLRMTIGTDGIPRRIWIKQPLGYGLDARTVETATKFRFRPGLKNGKPAAMEIVVNQAYDANPPGNH